MFAAVAKLERQLGIALLDRSAYRVGLTKAGRAFHRKARAVLQELALLSRFFAARPAF